MSEFKLVNVTVTDESYVVSCWKCGEKFDATSSSWCSCDAKLRTLQCPHCASCFCNAPFVYRQRFWNASPKTLRENPRRFCVSSRKAVPLKLEGTPAAKASPLQRPHVLIVDDDEPIRSLAAYHVEEMGYRVSTASNAEEALLMVDAVAFDVVLTDALMPKMDGRELCRRLKDAHGSEIKVILMTSLYKAGRFRTEAKFVFKVDEFLLKPLHPEELRKALRRVAPLLAQSAGRDLALAG
jgi:CheY-like chemotaxis protein